MSFGPYVTFGFRKCVQQRWRRRRQRQQHSIQQTIQSFEKVSNINIAPRYGVYIQRDWCVEWKSRISLFHSMRILICLFPIAVCRRIKAQKKIFLLWKCVKKINWIVMKEWKTSDYMKYQKCNKKIRNTEQQFKSSCALK